MAEAVTKLLKAAASTYAELAADAGMHVDLMLIADLLVKVLLQGNKLLFAGNGGSAADCQHMAGEFISRFMFDRNPLPAVALTTDSSVITSIGNDYGYDQVFSRQIRGLAKAGDVLLVYSTSGKSPNIIKALKEARELDVSTVGFTGSIQGEMGQYCDHLLRVPSTCVPRIQEGHLLIGHVICEIVEQCILGS